MEALQKVKVEVRNVSLAYGATQVLHDVSVTVEPGEFFALLGPSGSGKSTLLRLIAGFNQAQSGQVLIGGEDLSRVPPWKRDIGMVFQNYALWPHMTVAQNVAFGLEERRLPKEAVRAKVAAALELVGLTHFSGRRPGQLSGGQQQRVALARTIAIEPKVLLLDEPLSNLDAKLRVYMRAELLSLQRKLGITTIFVTHDQEEALSISDRVAVLDHGVIQQIGTPMELYDHPANRFIADFVGTINLLPGRVQADPGGVRFESAVLGRIDLPRDTVAQPDAEIAIRPHALRLAPAGQPGDAGRIWLEGVVTEREFLGEFVRYRVKVGDTEFIADETHFIGGASHLPGAHVKLGIDPAQVKLLS
ncbi:MAG TPA: ABC transporter ATP-binding protein [Burkholderiales bacterium]|nr:ABC transporter ATP-binding protein [Burkholderiales bacterium]